MALVTISIEGLALHARHGVLEAERILGQHFFLDLTITAEVGDALESDRLEDSVHYGQIIKAATATFTSRNFNLIEAAARAVADDLLERFPAVTAVKVTVHKPSAPVSAILRDLSASVERRR